MSLRLSVARARPGIVKAQGSYLVQTPSGMGLGNRFLSISVGTSNGLQPNRLFSKSTSLAFADLPYLYRVLGGWETPAFMESD